MDIKINYSKVEEDFIKANKEIMNKILPRTALMAVRAFVDRPEMKVHFRSDAARKLILSALDDEIKKL